MTNAMHPPIKLFQFPRMFGIPNVSPFCCKLETWLRIAQVPYEVVDTPDPRVGPNGKLPFIEDAGMRIPDSSFIVDHLVKTRGVDPEGRRVRRAASQKGQGQSPCHNWLLSYMK
jgi:glutathione S-transferase